MKIALFARDWDMEAWTRRIRAYLPEAEIFTPDQIAGQISDPAAIDYAYVWKPDPGFLASLQNLKLICSLGAGVDFLLNDPSLPHVPILRVVDPDLTARMSEYVLLQCLMHHRRSLLYLREQRDAVWRDRADAAANQVRVGLLGLGELGQDAAAKLAMVGYDVAGWSRSKKEIDGITCYHGEDGLDALLARTDILVCLLPHTPQTEGILSLPLFEKLARDGALGGPVLINAGRGKLQIEADIVDALERKILVGASLDVFKTEPLPSDSPLWSREDVILTPHNAAVSDPDAIARLMAGQIRKFEKGEPLDHVVDQRRGY